MRLTIVSSSNKMPNTRGRRASTATSYDYHPRNTNVVSTNNGRRPREACSDGALTLGVDILIDFVTAEDHMTLTGQVFRTAHAQ